MQHTSPKPKGRRRRRIQKLAEDVINQIAAGEVVQRPASAVKELLENAIDAGSTVVKVTLKKGGLGELSVADDGCGIDKEDFPLLCERFATSKLRSFSELSSVATHGFRGEALASVSYCAVVTVTSKRQSQACAYQCTFANGKPTAALKPCAAKKGTTVTALKLFYNMALRLKECSRRVAAEYRECLKVVTHYAVHYPAIGFSLVHLRSTDLQTRGGAESSKRQVMAKVFGKEAAAHLVDVAVADCGAANGLLRGYALECLVSDCDYACNIGRGKAQNSAIAKVKSKGELLVFVNGRMVESSGIRRTIDRVYSDYLATSGSGKVQCSALVYCSIVTPRECVDVNVHPSKREVRILHSDALLEVLHSNLFDALKATNHCRTFAVAKMAKVASVPSAKCMHKPEITDVSAMAKQITMHSTTDSTIPQIRKRKFDCISDDAIDESSDDAELTDFVNRDKWRSSERSVVKRAKRRKRNVEMRETVDVTKLVRTDSRQSQLSLFWNSSQISQTAETHTEEGIADKSDIEMADGSREDGVEDESSEKKAGANESDSKEEENNEWLAECLSAIRQMVADNCEAELKDLLSHSVFVGCIDDDSDGATFQRALFQSGTKLFVCDLHRLSRVYFFELFVNKMLAKLKIKGKGKKVHTDVGFGFDIGSRPQIRELVTVGLDLAECHWKEVADAHSKEEVVASVVSVLSDERVAAVLSQFGVRIADGTLHALPTLLPGLLPPLIFLPVFLIRVVTQLDWSRPLTAASVKQLCMELARFYQIRPKVFYHCEFDLETAIQNEIFHNFKKGTFNPPTFLKSDGTIVQLACTQQLYKVFERC